MAILSSELFAKSARFPCEVQTPAMSLWHDRPGLIQGLQQILILCLLSSIVMFGSLIFAVHGAECGSFLFPQQLSEHFRSEHPSKAIPILKTNSPTAL